MIIGTCVIELNRFWLAQQKEKPAAPAGSAMPLPLKIGRNDLCPCGSGRKYKHCCGSAQPQAAEPEPAPEAPKA